MQPRLLVVLGVCGALGLAACGSDGEVAAVAPATPDTTPDTTATPLTSEVTVTTSPAVTTEVPATEVPATEVPATEAPVASSGPQASTVDDLLALGRPIVLAHAGGEDQFPHSTPYAFDQSVLAGVDMLDFDVQLSGDGVLVVQHDGDVDRTTEGTGMVADMTYAQLQELDNAYWFTATCVCRDQPDEAYLYRGMRTGDVPPPPGATADDFSIPRFRDIVEQYPDIPLNIEIKGNGPSAVAAAEELARELTELDRLDAAVVTSFDDAVVAAFAAAAPTVELTPGLGLSTAWVLDGTPLPDGMRILQLPPEYEGLEVLTPEMIAATHDAGYLIWVWPNDREWETADGYRELLEMGMDGLNINFPALGVEAVTTWIP